MLTIEVKSNRKVITHLEVANIDADRSKTVYCITNILGKPTFAMPPDAEWHQVVTSAINIAVGEGRKEIYDRQKK